MVEGRHKEAAHQACPDHIGSGATGTQDLGSVDRGVSIHSGASNNTIGVGNVIAQSANDGVEVINSGTTGSAITENGIFDNDSGIALCSGAYGGIDPPVIAGISLGSIEITGTACASCTVEFFANGDDDGVGEAYLGSTATDATGLYTVTLASSPGAHYLTATATDPISGTSEFSAPFETGLSWVLLPVVLRTP